MILILRLTLHTCTRCCAIHNVATAGDSVPRIPDTLSSPHSSSIIVAPRQWFGEIVVSYIAACNECARCRVHSRYDEKQRRRLMTAVWLSGWTPLMSRAICALHCTQPNESSLYSLLYFRKYPTYFVWKSKHIFYMCFYVCY